MIRLLTKPAGKFALTFEVVDPDSGGALTPTTVTLKIRNVNGSIVFDSAAGEQEAASLDDATASCEVPATALDKLGSYAAEWTCGLEGDDSLTLLEDIELVGGHLFTIAQLRKDDSSEFATRSDADLAQVRIAVEQVIEDAAMVACVPRGRHAVVDGSGKRHLVLPDLEVRRVVAVQVNGVAWDPEQIAELTVADDRVYLPAGRTWPAGIRNITLDYEHGRDRAPQYLSRQGIKLAKEYLSAGDIDGRATAQQVGDQMFRLTIAGRDGTTGLPEVDAAIAQFGRKFRSG